MNEKAQEDEFDDDEADDEIAARGDDVDVDHLIRDIDKRKRSGPKVTDPAWRKLERIREEPHTADLVSDFDDYDIGDGKDSRHAGRSRGHAG